MGLEVATIKPEQIKKIHTLLSVHKIGDEAYKELLANKYNVSSSRYLSEEEASELIEYLINVTGDTYDKDNNTEYYQRKQAEKKKEEEEFYDDLLNYIDKKVILVNETIHRFAEGYSKTELINIFLKYTSKEDNIKILKELIE